MSEQKPAVRRFPVAAVIGSAVPLALIWLVLWLTRVVDSGTLTALAIAIVVLVAITAVVGTARMNSGS